MNKTTSLGFKQYINNFTARGEITIAKNKLSFDFKNGIASFRFKNRRDIDIKIIEKLSNHWIDFKDYDDIEKNKMFAEFNADEHFAAYLIYSHHDNYAICFEIKSIIKTHKKNAKTYNVEIYSEALLNHFCEYDKFDYNSNGYIEDKPCASFQLNTLNISMYKIVGVMFSYNNENYKTQFPKTFYGGFRFESDKPMTNEIIMQLELSVNSYCNFILKESGNYIEKIILENKKETLTYDKIYYSKEPKSVTANCICKFDDIKNVFENLFLQFISNRDFSPLYFLSSNPYKNLDILRIASMFENQYRYNVNAGIADYIEKERLYKEAYLNCIIIKESNGELEKKIIQGEKSKRIYSLTSSLSDRLKFVFDKLLVVLGTTKKQIKNGFGCKFYKYDITKFANRIKDARNDTAHFLQQQIDYNLAMKDTVILQKIIYFMIFEQVGLDNDKIKQIILEDSRYIQYLFGINK